MTVSRATRTTIRRVHFLIARAGQAHEFWVQPSKFQIAPSAALSIALQVGDGPMRQRSRIPLHRITRFDAIGPSGELIDLRASLAATAKHDVTFDAPGTYVLALATDNRAYSHRERYSRAAKSIVQVGAASGQSQAYVTQPLGLPLEIVPLVSPCSEPRPIGIPVRIVYEGYALPGAHVKLYKLEQELTPVDVRRTDHTGLATFPVPASGSWLMSVVWTQRLESSPDADFETIFASLTFGCVPGGDRTNR
jgi:uncharacterized GH25 family protein